jgi:hypothetical protein
MMVGIPKVTIHVDLDNLDTINDEVLLWELCRRRQAQPAAKKTKRIVPHVVIELPIFADHSAEVIMTEDAFHALMGDWKVESEE